MMPPKATRTVACEREAIRLNLEDAVVFDLDGTLVDTGADIAAAVNRTLADDGREPRPQAEIEGLTGLGAEVLIERVYAAAGGPPADRREATERYVAHYAANPADYAAPFADAREALAGLHARGVALAVCTNKHTSLARAVLAATGLDGLLGAVIGADAVSRPKPDPEHLRAAMHAVGADPGRTLYVGDNEVDVQTARAAGVRCAIVAWGRAADFGAPRLERFADLLA
jgi:phosphoglycolate phosphatase